ncbi:MAG: TetR family transcriptional regulator [Bacteroidetes bacterium]|nr:TetR family transcriptional regulator [Bacteroidota bacterium]
MAWKSTVREIANHLELTDGALYRHFSGKKEIISLLIDDIEESF